MITACLPYRADLEPDMQEAVQGFERRYGTSFEHLVKFTPELLTQLHTKGPLGPNIRVASAADPAVGKHLEIITAIANLPAQATSDRIRYLQSLIGIYDLLPRQVHDAVADRDAVLLAPQREGRMLAEHLGCLTGERFWTPQAKRIHSAEGLLVGVDDNLPGKGAREVVILDGVVASGVTQMALMHLTAQPGTKVEIFSCHATLAGALAVERYANLLGVELTLHVGHISGDLDKNFYAVNPNAPDQMVLGDVGDTISPLDGAA